ncbi:MAG: extracellular solute-binding protein [Anaerolineae bacterium]|nr:extracellular solute-binding protein [Anaerolineae bacterium]MDW8171849.1 extracellular solute-binding protein [Anaerolineae bacterium]
MRRAVCFCLCLALLSALSLAQDVQPTEAPSTSLVVWLPDRLTPLDSPALARLREQTQAFTEASGMAVELRLKRVGDVGGIMATLRSASIAAPAALPDLTLLRRQDLLSAERDGLLQRLDGLLSAALIAELGRPLALGQVNNVLYGLVYTLDIEHVAYRPQPDVDASAWHFDAVLERGLPLAFSPAYANGLNDTFMAQYLAAGGSFNAEGSLVYDAEAAARLLNFYAQARAREVVSSALLSLNNPADVLALLQSGQVDQAIINSSAYLSLQAQDRSLRPAPIPSVDGRLLGVLNGWSWTLLASTPERQAAAMRYVVWLMDAARLAEFSAAAAQIPSLPAARQQDASLSREDAAFYQALLEAASLPFSQADSGALTRAMHDALISVIDGTRSADEALRWLKEQVED